MKVLAKVTGALILAAALAAPARPAEVQFDLAGIGGFAVAPDNVTLVVSLTGKTELVYYNTVTGKETKRQKVEFQPTKLALQGKTLFAAQKGGGVVHILDIESGKELTTANAGGPVRNLACHPEKGPCWASNDNREVYAIDAKGTSSKSSHGGTFLALDPNNAFVCTVIEGRVRTDLMKATVDGKTLRGAGTVQRVVNGNTQSVHVSGDGKQVGVVAGGGWSGADRRYHYAVPVYSTADMKTMLGEFETGAYPNGCTFHPALPLAFACTGKSGKVFSTKSFAGGQALDAPRAGPPTVLAFVGKGKKLAWGTTSGDSSLLKFIDVDLTKEQEAELEKVYGK